MKKIVVSGLAAGIVMLVVSVVLMVVLSAIFPATMAEYENTLIFRPWSDPLMYYVYLHPIIMGLVLAAAWDKVKDSIKYKDSASRGLMFGLYVWILFGIPGMLMSLSTFNVSMLLVVTWTMSVLFQDLAGGLMVSSMNK